MEEKEPIKVKLSTVLLIIAVVVIIVMGVIIGIMYKQSITKENNVTNTENVNAINNNANTEKTFSETEIKDKFKSFLNLFGSYQGSPYSVLDEMKRITGKDVVDDEYPEGIKFNEEYILPTNIKYTEFKDFMLNYMTEEVFNTQFAQGYVNKNGDLYCKNIGATGIEYEVKGVEKENNSNTKYSAKVDMIYTDENKEQIDIKFKVANNNGKCVISSITLPSENMKDDEEDEIKVKNNKKVDNLNKNEKETSKTDYSKYFGTWSDGSENEFKVRNIGNDLITFTWSIYRAALIEDVTLPFKDNKAVFYYHGFDDKNFNSKNEDDEFYCRKVIVELKENSISIKVENSTLAESNENISLDKTDLFIGGVYIQPGQYNFTSKK